MVCGCSAVCRVEMCGSVCVWMCVRVRSSLHSVHFGQLLCCAHKCIVNIMKMFIERNNIQVELIRFRKKIATLLTLVTLKWEYTFATDVFMKLDSLLSVTSRH